MKLLTKITAATLLGSLLMTAAAAQSHHQAQVATAATIQKMQDDTPVTIKGKIVRSLGNEKYELQDSTGKLRVEIDNEHGLPNQLLGKTITITGDTDVKRDGRVEVDADWVRFH